MGPGTHCKGGLETNGHWNMLYHQLTCPVALDKRSSSQCFAGVLMSHRTPSHLHPNVVCSNVVIPTQKKMVPMSWLVAHWSSPTHMASASRKGTAIVPLKHVR